MNIYLSLLIAVIGALVYGLLSNAKVQELGRLAFFAGLLVFLFSMAGQAITFGR